MRLGTTARPPRPRAGRGPALGGIRRRGAGARGGVPRVPGSRGSAAALRRNGRAGGGVTTPFDAASLEPLQAALERLGAGFAALPAAAQPAANPELERVLLQVADRLRDNYPYHHPLYAGQMLQPPHPLAPLAYALALWLNPNNHALDGGRASSAMEREADAALARISGWVTHRGHLCGGGTMANLQALWVAGQLHPGVVVLASTQAHYTHRRLSAVLGLAFEAVPCERSGRLDVTRLERRLAAGGVGTVGATIGTTATGAVDPLAELVALRARYGFRLHAHAAHRGHLTLGDQP